MLPLPSIGINKKQQRNNERPFRVIELELFPPTSRHYPRIDYEEICRELKFDSTTTKQKEESQNEEFRDRDADEIVRRLEEKYGTGTISMTTSTAATSNKKPKKNKKALNFAPEDVMDKGLGYVQEDDFIDDTEAYDEWVPTIMDTAKGGHYVNMGPLEFRQIDLDASTSNSTSESDSNSTAAEQLSSTGDEAEVEDLEMDEIKRKKPAKPKQKYTEYSSTISNPNQLPMPTVQMGLEKEANKTTE